MKVMDCQLITNGIDDAETLSFCHDLNVVGNCVHQGMMIFGPWMESRVKMILRSWLPIGWSVSGPAQIFDPNRSELRSRSWDLVIHRQPQLELPPIASPEMGYSLLPRDDVATVIDTKALCNDLISYARRPVFNLANDATEEQLVFMGAGISKMILIARSSRSPDSLFDAGETLGLMAFSLGRYKAGPVSHGVDREMFWRLERHSDGSHPFQRFKAAILLSVERFSAVPRVPLLLE